MLLGSLVFYTRSATEGNATLDGVTWLVAGSLAHLGAPAKARCVTLRWQLTHVVEIDELLFLLRRAFFLQACLNMRMRRFPLKIEKNGPQQPPKHVCKQKLLVPNVTSQTSDCYYGNHPTVGTPLLW